MQSAIGWDELLRGRICSQWALLVEQHHRHRNLPWTTNSSAWETTVIRSILQLFLRTWQRRNELIHGASEIEQQEITGRNVDSQIRNVYAQGTDNILPQHRPLFTQFSVQTRLQLPLEHKQQWLRSVQAARSAWIAAQTEPEPD